MTEPWYQDLFPGLSLTPRRQRVMELSTTDQGYRYAAGVGGAVLGRGADLIVVDDPHVKEVANSISMLGFSVPVLIDQADGVLDGLVRVEAAKLLGLPTLPCVVAGHLTTQERKLLRLAINRLGEKGSWNLPELKLEFEDLVADELPIEITGFDLPEIDSILIGDDTVVEEGPVAPQAGIAAVARLGDVFVLGPHRVVCGDARDPAVLRALMADDVAGMVFTDEPYNVAIKGNVTGGAHREFAMASGEMTKEQFRAFNDTWIGTALAHLGDRPPRDLHRLAGPGLRHGGGCGAWAVAAQSRRVGEDQCGDGQLLSIAA